MDKIIIIGVVKVTQVTETIGSFFFKDLQDRNVTVTVNLYVEFFHS